MQQLSGELKNVPTDAQQVCSTTNLALNRDQSLSESSKVLTDNNLDVDQVQHTGRPLQALVYVAGFDNIIKPCLLRNIKNDTKFISHLKVKNFFRRQDKYKKQIKIG